MVADVQNSPSFMGVPMKQISLLTIMHYSRIMPTKSRYFTSTAVLLNEMLKLVICTIIAIRDRKKQDGEHTTLATSVRNLFRDVFSDDSWKLAIPAVLYTLQNNLQYVGVSNLDAATFQVTYQLKILTTALFSVTMLGRRLSSAKWLSLIILTAGVAVVQMPSSSSSAAAAPPIPAKGYSERLRDSIRDLVPHGSNSSGSKEAGAGHLVDSASEMNRMVGLTAVIVACILSGIAGVYFEKVLKRSSTSLWLRNIQLSFFSLFPALFAVVFKDGKQVAERGFFDGYNGVVWLAIVFQAVGGIVVALCVNYADNIAKNFATSISILISCIASVYFFDFIVSSKFVIGAALVLYATYLYGKPDAAPQKRYVPLEKTVVETPESPTPTSKEMVPRRG